MKKGTDMQNFSCACQHLSKLLKPLGRIHFHIPF